MGRFDSKVAGSPVKSLERRSFLTNSSVPSTRMPQKPDVRGIKDSSFFRFPLRASTAAIQLHRRCRTLRWPAAPPAGGGWRFSPFGGAYSRLRADPRYVSPAEDPRTYG